MLLLSQSVRFTNRSEVVSWSCGRGVGVSGPGNTKEKEKSKIQSEVTLLSRLQQKQQKERNEFSLIYRSVFYPTQKTEEDQHQLRDIENKSNHFHQLMIRALDTTCIFTLVHLCCSGQSWGGRLLQDWLLFPGAPQIPEPSASPASPAPSASLSFAERGVNKVKRNILWLRSVFITKKKRGWRDETEKNKKDKMHNLVHKRKQIKEEHIMQIWWNGKKKDCQSRGGTHNW